MALSFQSATSLAARLRAGEISALELLDRVSDSDQVALVTTGGEARLLFAPTRDHYTVRRRIAWTSATKSGRSAAVHTIGAMTSW